MMGFELIRLNSVYYFDFLSDRLYPIGQQLILLGNWNSATYHFCSVHILKSRLINIVKRVCRKLYTCIDEIKQLLDNINRISKLKYCWSSSNNSNDNSIYQMYVFNMTNLFLLLTLFRMKTTKKKWKRGSQRWSRNSLTGVRVWISQNGWHRLTVILGIRVFIFFRRSFHPSVSFILLCGSICPFVWFIAFFYIVHFINVCVSFFICSVRFKFLWFSFLPIMLLLSFFYNVNFYAL